MIQENSKVNTEESTKESRVPRPREKGGVALEYLLVTTFAAIASISLLGFMGTMTKKKLESFAKKLDVSIEDVELNPFKD